jgi:hypothetical protein
VNLFAGLERELDDLRAAIKRLPKPAGGYGKSYAAYVAQAVRDEE